MITFNSGLEGYLQHCEPVENVLALIGPVNSYTSVTYHVELRYVEIYSGGHEYSSLMVRVGY